MPGMPCPHTTGKPNMSVIPLSAASLCVALALSPCSHSAQRQSNVTPPAAAEQGASGMIAPAVPTLVTAKPQPAPKKPVGPHGRHDPHGSLGPEKLVKVALQHESEGRLELALKTLAEGIERYPDAAELYAVRASLRLQLQQVATALRDLEKAVELAPGDARIRVNRAQAYRSFGRYDDAMADLDHAVRQSPDLLPARFNRGALLYAQNRFDAALVDFEHCIAVDPHSPAPYFNRASTYWELGRADEAVKDMEHFLELAQDTQWKKTAQDLLNNWKTAMTRAAEQKSES